MNQRLFGGRGFTLLQAQHWAGTLAAACAFLGCAVSGEIGPAMLIAVGYAQVSTASSGCGSRSRSTEPASRRA